MDTGTYETIYGQVHPLFTIQRIRLGRFSDALKETHYGGRGQDGSAKNLQILQQTIPRAPPMR
jgi:hypothetical protein